MVKVVVDYILDAEIINNEYKHNGAPFVVPKPWRSGGFVVASIVKARAEKVIGQHAGLGETVASLYNFEVYPSIICIRDEIVFLDELLWNVFKADSNKLWSIHW